MNHTRSTLTRFADDMAASTGPNGFDTKQFYQRWFPKERSYFFLFRKNLRVTNLQHAEIMALARTSIAHSSSNDVAPSDIQFMTSHEFKEAMSRLLQDLPLRPQSATADANTVAQLYHRVISGTVILDSYYGSAILCLPHHLGMDLSCICGTSGYIHSCGQLIYARTMGNAKKEELYTEIKEYLRRDNANNEKTFFAVYAHEDFSEHDQEKRSELRNGLDEAKLFTEKCYVEGIRMVDLLKDMRQLFHADLVIPKPGDFRTMHKRARRQKDVRKERTLWLIRDSGVSPHDASQPTKDHYYICYEQRYLNQNVFHLFDENKPGWLAHTTIPHTLAAAMVNITRPKWPTKRRTVILDPFSGSGTVCIEAAKYKNVKVLGADKDPCAISFFMTISGTFAQTPLHFRALRRF